MHACPLSTCRAFRLLTEKAIVAAALLLMLQTWCVEGLVPSCRVESGSMAPTLLGTHREVVCGDCGYAFVCGTDAQPVGARAVCPNCGYPQNDLQLRPDLPGDRLLIHKAIFRMRQPRRWEVAAFRHPQRSSQTAIKRIVGLPGESVEIRDGNLYIDGRLQRKSLFEQRVLAVPVHDARFRPLEPALPPRWQMQSKNSRWGSHDGRFAHPDSSDPEIDWIEYCHWQRLPDEEAGVFETPVTDQWNFDCSRPRRNEDINPTAELMLRLTFERIWGEGELVLRAIDGHNQFDVRLNPAQRRYHVLRNDREIPAASGKINLLVSGTELELSLIDRQFVLAIDGTPLVTWPYEFDGQQAAAAPSRPLAIGSRGVGVVIRDLRVLRDVYYTQPKGGAWGIGHPYQLGENEYFVLGDNSPISQDSRTWAPEPAVSADLLVGKPFLVHFPARRVEWLGYVFHVPDLAEIRYIR